MCLLPINGIMSGLTPEATREERKGAIRLGPGKQGIARRFVQDVGKYLKDDDMAKKIAEKPKYSCKDCANARDFHERDSQGEFFLCKCDYQRRSMFLKRDYCGNFKKK